MGAPFPYRTANFCFECAGSHGGCDGCLRPADRGAFAIDDDVGDKAAHVAALERLWRVHQAALKGRRGTGGLLPGQGLTVLRGVNVQHTQEPDALVAFGKQGIEVALEEVGIGHKPVGNGGVKPKLSAAQSDQSAKHPDNAAAAKSRDVSISSHATMLLPQLPYSQTPVLLGRADKFSRRNKDCQASTKGEEWSVAAKSVVGCWETI